MNNVDWDILTTEEKIIELLKCPMSNWDEKLESITEMVKKDGKFYYAFLKNEIKNNNYQYPFNSFRDFKKFEKENPQVVYFQALWEYQRLALNWVTKRGRRADNKTLQKISQLAPIKNAVIDTVDDITQFGLLVYTEMLSGNKINDNFEKLDITRFSKWELSILLKSHDLSSRELVSYVSIRYPDIYQNQIDSINPSLPAILNELIGVKFKIQPRYQNQELKDYFKNLANPEAYISYERYKLLESIEKHYTDTLYFPRSPKEIVKIMPYVDELFKDRKYEMASFEYGGDIIFENLSLKTNEVRAFFMALAVKQLLEYVVGEKNNNPNLAINYYIEYIKSLNTVIFETALEALKRNGIKYACEKDVLFYNWRLGMEYVQIRGGLRKVLYKHLKKMKGDTIAKRFSRLSEFDLKEKDYIQNNNFHYLWKRYQKNVAKKEKKTQSLYNTFSEDYVLNVISDMVYKMKLVNAVKLFKKWGVDKRYWQALEDEMMMRKELGSNNKISSQKPLKIRKF